MLGGIKKGNYEYTSSRSARVWTHVSSQDRFHLLKMTEAPRPAGSSLRGAVNEELEGYVLLARVLTFIVWFTWGVGIDPNLNGESHRSCQSVELFSFFLRGPLRGVFNSDIKITLAWPYRPIWEGNQQTDTTIHTCPRGGRQTALTLICRGLFAYLERNATWTLTWSLTFIARTLMKSVQLEYSGTRILKEGSRIFPALASPNSLSKPKVNA